MGTVMPGGLSAWLWRNRTSPRLAFILRTVTMALSALLALFWARELVRVLGKDVYGLYLTLGSIVTLGGLGDLGISGAVGIRMMQHLAKGEDETGKRLLATARGTFLGIALLLLAAFAVLSPWLPGWFGFVAAPGAGSLPLLFAVGGASCAVMVLSGYVQNLNYIHGNVVWPILPAFVCTQLGFAAQWLLAVRGAPLWVQYAVQTGTSVLLLLSVGWMLRLSHPWLGDWWPIRWEPVEALRIAGTSFWVYLCTLGNAIYVATDQILVNAGFGAAPVPAYRFNYKLCELAATLLTTASFVAMPAIVGRILNAAETERAQGLSGLDRLQRLQALAAFLAATAYLCVNDAFIGLWVGADFQMPLALQAAFALNLVVAIAGDAGVQVRGRLGLDGVRLAGLAIGGTGLLNLALSLVAMKAGSLVGIAAATVVAQSTLSFVMNRSTCTQMGLRWGPWLLRTWAVPVAGVGLSILLRVWFPPDTLAHGIRLVLLHLPLLVAMVWALGIRRQFIVDEWRLLRSSVS